jgi:hypothetical protein
MAVLTIHRYLRTLTLTLDSSRTNLGSSHHNAAIHMKIDSGGLRTAP